MKSFRKIYFDKKYYHLYKQLEPFLHGYKTVLDVGCGNLFLARLVKKYSKTEVVGVDIVDLSFREKDINFIKYDGKKLPFDNKKFEISYAVDVLHHTVDINGLLDEMVRVTKRRVIILERVYTNSFELLLSKIIDLTNWIDSFNIPLPFNFHTTEDWIRIFKKYSKNIQVIDFKSLMDPQKTRVFIIDL